LMSWKLIPTLRSWIAASRRVQAPDTDVKRQVPCRQSGMTRPGLDKTRPPTNKTPRGNEQ
jgi:hypothetical protein